MQLIVCHLPLRAGKRKKRRRLQGFIAVLLVVACCSFHAASQNVTLSETNARLEKIFREIKGQTGYTFFATKEQLQKAKPVTIQADNVNLETVLKSCFKDQPLDYTMINTTISVFDRKEEKKAATDLPPADTTTLIIHGKVSNEKGEALAQATVSEKGTTNSTATAADGTFFIKLRSPKAVLAISYVGYRTYEVHVNAKSGAVGVTLVAAALTNDSVIIVGYGRQRKQSIVGAITQVRGDVLERTGGVSSLGATLTGNLPGVITVASQGTPGAEDPKIYIRGQSTWNNSDPLILVDGIERPMNSVDISSVENISVLKDASATAVFGVKGANGVILITTKRGREGKADIRFTANTTMKMPSKLASKYDAYDAIRIRDMAIENELAVSPASWSNFVPYAELNKYRHPANQAEAERYPNIDWQDQLIKKFAMSYNANLNISGGTSFVKYFSSIDFLHEGDIIKKIDNGKTYKPGYGFDRVNARTNLDFNLTKTTVLTANLAGSYGTRQD
ncbi:MAG TPA: TonB-dependent receptor plug domain-containing protein, partial [Chitinophagaceae bacterium]|nr:TonB-dependent receptor plug domain-containing protein [Chitinophagaceae bacterium]